MSRRAQRGNCYLPSYVYFARHRIERGGGRLICAVRYELLDWFRGAGTGRVGVRFGSFGSQREGGRARHTWEMHDGMMLVHEMADMKVATLAGPFPLPVAQKATLYAGPGRT